MELLNISETVRCSPITAPLLFLCSALCVWPTVSMGDEEEPWQVAGARGRRRPRGSDGGNETSRRGKNRAPRQTSNRPSSHKSTSTSNSATGDRAKRTPHAGYSYKTTSNRKQPREQTDKERVATELQRLERLKSLLIETALWERLVGGLRSVLPQVGLAVAPPSPPHLLVDPTINLPLLADERVQGAAPSAGLAESETVGEQDGASAMDRGPRSSSIAGHLRRSPPAAAARAARGLSPNDIISRQETAEDTSAPTVADSASLCLPPHVTPKDSEHHGTTRNDPPHDVEGKLSLTTGEPRSPRRQPLCEVVCYGIGNFSESHNSRYQLALALCVRDLISSIENPLASRGTGGTDIAKEGGGERGELPQEEQGGAAASPPPPPPPPPPSGAHRDDPEAFQEGGGPPRSTDSEIEPAMLVFDPVMNDMDTAILASLGCRIPENEQGKRCCYGAGRELGQEEGDGKRRRTRPTLFFMPHCPIRLYSNVLWANWSSEALGSMIILGNRLSAYRDRTAYAHKLHDPTNSLFRAEPLLQEITLCPYLDTVTSKARRRRDIDRLPFIEGAFNDLTLSFSAPEARATAEGIEALSNRPLEFVEEEDGELVLGEATLL